MSVSRSNKWLNNYSSVILSPLKKIHSVALDKSVYLSGPQFHHLYRLRLSNRIRDGKYMQIYAGVVFAYPGRASPIHHWIKIRPQNASQPCSTQSLLGQTLVFSLLSDVTSGSNISILKKAERYSVHVVCTWTKKGHIVMARWSLKGKMIKISVHLTRNGWYLFICLLEIVSHNLHYSINKSGTF